MGGGRGWGRGISHRFSRCWRGTREGVDVVDVCEKPE